MRALPGLRNLTAEYGEEHIMRRTISSKRTTYTIKHIHLTLRTETSRAKQLDDAMKSGGYQKRNRGRAGGRARRFVFVPPNLDSFMAVHKIARFHAGSVPLVPTAVHIRTSEPPRQFEPFHSLAWVGSFCRITMEKKGNMTSTNFNDK